MALSELEFCTAIGYITPRKSTLTLIVNHHPQPFNSISLKQLVCRENEPPNTSLVLSQYIYGR